MRIEGTFLRSKVARRAFWALLAAALLPLAIFGALGYQALSHHLADRDRKGQIEQAKVVALRVYDRLTAASGVLAAHASGSSWADPSPVDPVVLKSLSSVITATHDGHLVAGDGELSSTWQHSMVGESPPSPRRLLWVMPATSTQPSRILLSHPDPGGRGWWVAEVQPALLWSDFVEGGIGEPMCVSDVVRGHLLCPAAPEGTGASWSLFLGSFGSADWRFERVSGPLSSGLRGLPLGTLAVQGLVATILLIVGLALVQVRRTMRPLEQLGEGTLRLAAQDWSARVEVDSHDEFGALAQSFNTMAERVGRQVHAMKVQAAIDRAILGGIDIASVMQQVVERLQAIAPGAGVAVVVGTSGSGTCRVHRADTTTALSQPPEPWPGGAAAAGAERMLAAPPALRAWSHAAVGTKPDGALSVHGLCAVWHGEQVALLLMTLDPAVALDGEAQQEVCGLRDRVTVALAAASREALLTHRATRDALTGLLNAHGMQEVFDRLEAQANPSFSALFVDLDAFKDVNDTLGHQVGDELLRCVARRLNELVAEGDFVARNGGDEFLLLHLGEPAEAGHLASAICAALAQPFSVSGHVLHIGASVGIASCPENGCSREEVMRKSDMAMYAAKAAGRGRWCTYDSAMEERVQERAWIAQDLRNALFQQGHLSLHYQPRVQLKTGRTESAEALLRWRHPTRGMVPPLQFISVAEDTGLILPLGRWVLGQAIQQLRAWRDAGVSLERVAVNVSARQLQDPDFVAQVLGMLAENGLSAKNLEIEITESLFLGDATVACERLSALRDRGVLVAMDDFGTGYSSLSALHKLPVDVLKIDRAFVIELGGRESADAVAKSIVVLARALGKQVVADGVETEVQKERLALMGCDEIQGYLYARPMPPQELVAWMHRGVMSTTAEPA